MRMSAEVVCLQEQSTLIKVLGKPHSSDDGHIMLGVLKPGERIEVVTCTWPRLRRQLSMDAPFADNMTFRRLLEDIKATRSSTRAARAFYYQRCTLER